MIVVKYFRIFDFNIRYYFYRKETETHPNLTRVRCKRIWANKNSMLLSMDRSIRIAFSFAIILFRMARKQVLGHAFNLKH
ncbi:hypothetical protein LEP1GSC120_1887 [Leptospira santarosai str. 200702252]|uniref:Uncharacterized protein n=2 Tax=Leptospira santarosai TaxID=28183 RepID=A0AB73LN43_9LEPT|nr:hypothetical protein B2G51_16995 [Leptospira santarosai]EMO72952.1 hypothetical protein LEP1GSC130_0978 [Leptospira santarosai str. 200403458]EMO99010.1 hypothetical protein LEP1GSC120_1887 [Leptospira santarosai str. 200702252]OLY65569.1 hypothetical protein BWD11_03410 [Leptospira santarosai serovar Grippotyphosa]ONF81140.1 hypothetical protein BWD12_03115 [Leptospira santarosai serovar Bananal]